MHDQLDGGPTVDGVEVPNLDVRIPGTVVVRDSNGQEVPPRTVEEITAEFTRIVKRALGRDGATGEGACGDGLRGR